MNIPEKVRQTLEESTLVWIGTCSNGVPNVNVICYFKLLDGERILLADNFFRKTKENIEKNPTAAVHVKSPGESVAYQLKGPVEVYTEGKIVHEMREWVQSQEEDMPAKAAVVMTVESVFDGSPGEDAGREIVE